MWSPSAFRIASILGAASASTLPHGIVIGADRVTKIEGIVTRRPLFNNGFTDDGTVPRDLLDAGLAVTPHQRFHIGQSINPGGGIMDNEHAARLAKALAVTCMRTTFPEDLDARISPSSRAGDHSDVMVVRPYGPIPWNTVSPSSHDQLNGPGRSCDVRRPLASAWSTESQVWHPSGRFHEMRFVVRPCKRAGPSVHKVQLDGESKRCRCAWDAAMPMLPSRCSADYSPSAVD